MVVEHENLGVSWLVLTFEQFLDDAADFIFFIVLAILIDVARVLGKEPIVLLVDDGELVCENIYYFDKLWNVSELLAQFGVDG